MEANSSTDFGLVLEGLEKLKNKKGQPVKWINACPSFEETFLSGADVPFEKTFFSYPNKISIEDYLRKLEKIVTGPSERQEKILNKKKRLISKFLVFKSKIIGLIDEKCKELIKEMCFDMVACINDFFEDYSNGLIENEAELKKRVFHLTLAEYYQEILGHQFKEKENLLSDFLDANFESFKVSFTEKMVQYRFESNKEQVKTRIFDESHKMFLNKEVLELEEQICSSTKGIAQNPCDPSQFLIMTSDGTVSEILLFEKKEEGQKYYGFQKSWSKCFECGHFYTNSVSFSPSGKLFLVSGRNSRNIFILDSKTKETQKEFFQTDNFNLLQGCLWINEKLFLGAYTDGIIKQFNPAGPSKVCEKLETLADFQGFQTVYREKDKEKLWFGSLKGCVAQINGVSLQKEWQMKDVHKSYVSAIAVYGDLLFSGGGWDDQRVKITSISKKLLCAQYHYPDLKIRNLFLSPDGCYLSVNAAKRVEILEIRSGLVTYEFTWDKSDFKDLNSVATDFERGLSFCGDDQGILFMLTLQENCSLAL